jgi:micrococcal nuclease
MNYNAFGNINILSHHEISKVVDGDSIFVKNKLTKEEFEVRLYGIDAPEIKKCAKLKQDEKETQIAGQLLMHLGRLSFHYLIDLAPLETNCTLGIELNNTIDVYGRTLAYLFLPDGRCVNEIMISEGYAKPINKYYCSQLSKYQNLNFTAKQSKKGLYSIVESF